MSLATEGRTRLLLSMVELSYLLEESGSVTSLVSRVLPFPSRDFTAQARDTAQGMLRVRLAEASNEVSQDEYSSALAAIAEGIVSSQGVVRLAIRGEETYSVIAFFGSQTSVELLIRADAWIEVSLFMTTELANQLASRHLSLDREFDVITDSNSPKQASLRLVYSNGVLTNGEKASIMLRESSLSNDQIRGGLVAALADRITAATASHGD